MWMSNILVVVDHNNVDRNNLSDIAAAVTEAGATVLDVDERNLVIEAAAPAEAVAVVSAMEGVAYVRCVFSYLCQACDEFMAESLAPAA